MAEPHASEKNGSNSLGSLKAEGIRWIFTQGPFAVILAVLMWWLYTKSNYLIDTAVPQHLQKIQDGYKELQASHEKTVTKLADTFEKEREREREMAKDAVIAIKELTAEISDQTEERQRNKASPKL